MKVPTVRSGGCQPSFDIYHCNGLSVTKIFSYTSKTFYNKNEGPINIELSEEEKNSFTMRGDTKIVFRHVGFTNKTLFRIMFNTAFIQNGNYIHAGKMELSPEDVRKDKGKIIPNDFVIYLQFEDFCDVCNPHKTEIDELCLKCTQELGPDIINSWLCVKSITDAHSFPTLE